MPDGLTRSVLVPCSSDEELSRLSVLDSFDAASELLQANPLRLINFSNAYLRLAAEREMLALARCFGVEGFASRAMHTARVFQSAIQLIRILEAQPTTQAGSRALISLVRAECADLVSSLTKERRGDHQTTDRRACPITTADGFRYSIVRGDGSETRSGYLDTLRSVAGRLSSEKVELQDQLQSANAKFGKVQRKHHTALRRVGDLEAQLASVNVFSPDALMYFIAGHVTFGGHWKHLHALLRPFKDGSSAPSAFRTSIRVSARDADTDDCGPYVLQATSQSRSQLVSSQSSAPSTLKQAQQTAQPPALSAFGSVKKTTQSPASAATTKSTISF
ncbi:hypothetical protein PR003_g10302 [Phytophthora rubi]|uniref:Uncharacterized protein n=1 Tax=Phytophthora rubi TaxID=129364 RepID=A0A6A4FPR5_9STRA|nr:hypothetical protein PR003_g10302 [Phytophthora rubi]